MQDLGASKGTKIVHAACGRNHTLLVGSDGSVWSAGVNNFGQVGVARLYLDCIVEGRMFCEQCGQSVCPQVTTFKLVTGIAYNGSKERVVMASAGLTFSAVLTESGRGICFTSTCDLVCVFMHFWLVFTFGSAEKGQLGNGTTGERITTGNKTAYDMDPNPSMLFLSFLL